jgi:hypothetical protein
MDEMGGDVTVEMQLFFEVPEMSGSVTLFN